jgi:hypothetical protein
MPIRELGPRIVDDTRTFAPDELTEIWAWLDSFDAQPLSAREGTQLVLEHLTFHQDRYMFRGRIYSVAKCSDGRELLGSIVGLIPPSANTAAQRVLHFIKKF